MKSKKILYADDSYEWRIKAGQYFKRHPNFLVEISEDADSAVEKTRSFKPDLVILDELQNECFRVIESIREFYKGPVVIYTGDLQILQQAEKIGVSSYKKIGGNNKSSLDALIIENLK